MVTKMKLLWMLGLVGLLVLLVSPAGASVVSRWTFDEGRGDDRCRLGG